MTPRSHNSARWLKVQWLPYRAAAPPIAEGWYVVRVCKCHSGLPVTIRLPTEARAERAMRAMLHASEALGT